MTTWLPVAIPILAHGEWDDRGDWVDDSTWLDEPQWVAVAAEVDPFEDE